MSIVSHIVSKGILSFRTALELKPTIGPQGLIVFMTSSYAKTVTLPGLIIKINKGDYQSHIEQVLPYLARSNLPRMLLENLTSFRHGKDNIAKTIGPEGVENFLARERRVFGEQRLNEIRDEAKQVAEDLGRHVEYKRLSQMISALLTTHSDPDILIGQQAKAVARKEPFDQNRIIYFEKLSLYLKKCRFRLRPYQYSKVSFKNIAFFESYFSNFIEGTEFVIEEAEDIVFKGMEVNNRHADSHDVLSSFNLANDFVEISRTPNNINEFFSILKDRHAFLMKERPEISPGEFKVKGNKAGNTYFVEPNEVVGTLSQGFEYYKLLTPGLERALFMQFLISEVHPFNDGNGRLSRIMMNAELVFADQFKIIMPTVFRDNYLNGLRMASRTKNFQLFVKMMDQAQAYTASIHWEDYVESRAMLEADSADKTSDEGMPIFNRALRQLKLSELAPE